jgi:SAM-dependent methyltransferase
MINVLASWDDLGQSILALQKDHHFHSDPLKNWDLAHIGRLLAGVPRTARILDAGCSASECSLLRYLDRKGFREMVGIDLRVGFNDRIHQLMLMKDRRTLKPPFKLVEGDIIRTPFESESFDGILSLSVIEHEVDLEKFLRESHRLLRPNGLLYFSTDYWPEKIDTEGLRHWGLRWNIFCRDEIDSLVEAAMRIGFGIEDRTIPPAKDPIVKWSGKEYTFLSVALKKMAG